MVRKTSVQVAAAMAAAAVSGLIAASPANAGGSTVQRIVNVHSGKCLEIPMYHDYDGAPAQQWDCNGGANQQWIEYSGEAGLFLENVNSVKMLDMPGGSTSNDTDAVQWWLAAYGQASNQEWYTTS
ncbi:RICIN domain-containing protein [Streptomyces goshikiensis]|uniref:RICIN domain-containing protein n=1 Tax=Streptomyces goshikiensis TaxID=1942 RepID=UPI0036923166